ncbi:hypothetical protein [Caldanaerobius polysaccharolyticus]|uniref:hypothetical protein n=1 Tax=Caldanaerobius polysaccharolyticus TaxID=44256 RepID=UPI00047DB0AE|nr:hypothetical protein [Caldanaerobius polysaccharolyticus]
MKARIEIAQIGKNDFVACYILHGKRQYLQKSYPSYKAARDAALKAYKAALNSRYRRNICAYVRNPVPVKIIH